MDFNLGNYFYNFFSPLISFLEKVLPTSPFRAYLEGYENGQSGLLSAVNYFVPISTFIAILEVWVAAMFLYFLYHGLIDKIWHAQNEDDKKVKAKFIGNIVSLFKKLVGKV